MLIKTRKQPCPLRPEVGKKLLQHLEKYGMKGFPTMVVGSDWLQLRQPDLGLTLEAIYRVEHNEAGHDLRKMSVMSQACQEWAGVDFRDPSSIFINETIGGHRHWSALYKSRLTWASLSYAIPMGLTWPVELDALPETRKIVETIKAQMDLFIK